MLFALLCTDKPNSVDLRMSVRPDHLKYLETLGSALKAAGPFTNDEGQPTGTRRRLRPMTPMPRPACSPRSRSAPGSG
jgi:uncharacterized protein YciI